MNAKELVAEYRQREYLNELGYKNEGSTPQEILAAFRLRAYFNEMGQ